jgi:uncharacterized protein (UPF0332 family)
MKPQTQAFLAAADEALSDANTILKVNIPRQAARLAYYAQFHAAQALIFERFEKIAKTHKGVDREFHKLAKSEPTFAVGFAAQLSKAYNYKEHADYSTDFSQPITPALASTAVGTAERFVAAIRLAIAKPPTP